MIRIDPKLHSSSSAVPIYNNDIQPTEASGTHFRNRIAHGSTQEEGGPEEPSEPHANTRSERTEDATKNAAAAGCFVASHNESNLGHDERMRREASSEEKRRTGAILELTDQAAPAAAGDGGGGTDVSLHKIKNGRTQNDDATRRVAAAAAAPSARQRSWVSRDATSKMSPTTTAQRSSWVARQNVDTSIATAIPAQGETSPAETVVMTGSEQSVPFSHPSSGGTGNGNHILQTKSVSSPSPKPGAYRVSPGRVDSSPASGSGGSSELLHAMENASVEVVAADDEQGEIQTRQHEEITLEAELVADSNSNDFRRSPVWFYVSLVGAIVVVTAVVVAVTVDGRLGQDSSSAVEAPNLNQEQRDPSTGPALTSNHGQDLSASPSAAGAIGTAPPNAESPSEATTALLCVQSTNELKEAIRLYLEDDGPKSSVALAMGWPMGNWCVSRVNDFSELFVGLGDFNVDISKWDTSSVTNMHGTFRAATSFNQNLEGWDVSKVTRMSNMFEGATSFNQDLSTWQVSGVTAMHGMFRNATSFNQNLDAWDVSQVTDMATMFYAARSFNGSISSWDVSRVTSFGAMFRETGVFNQPLPWKVSQATRTGGMFALATAFNQDLEWDVSHVINAGHMFDSATSFNGDTSRWDVRRLEKMNQMFRGTPFSRDVTKWNVSSVTDMSGMFDSAVSFNQDISTWQVSRVLDFTNMFQGTKAFNVDISNWDVSRATSLEGMFFAAEAFERNLCAWGLKLPNSTLEITAMFQNSKCQVKGDPSLSATPPGPFCVQCQD